MAASAASSWATTWTAPILRRRHSPRATLAPPSEPYGAAGSLASAWSCSCVVSATAASCSGSCPSTVSPARGLELSPNPILSKHTTLLPLLLATSAATSAQTLTFP